VLQKLVNASKTGELKINSSLTLTFYQFYKENCFKFKFSVKSKKSRAVLMLSILYSALMETFLGTCIYDSAK
jgi:hypothetical protein